MKTEEHMAAGPHDGLGGKRKPGLQLVSWVKNATTNYQADSGASDDYCRGMTVGLVSALMGGHRSFNYSIELVLKCVPEYHRPLCLCFPEVWWKYLEESELLQTTVEADMQEWRSKLHAAAEHVRWVARSMAPHPGAYDPDLISVANKIDEWAGEEKSNVGRKHAGRDSGGDSLD